MKQTHLIDRLSPKPLSRFGWVREYDPEARAVWWKLRRTVGETTYHKWLHMSEECMSQSPGGRQLLADAVRMTRTGLPNVNAALRYYRDF